MPDGPRAWAPPGPVSEAFVADTSSVSVLMGPIGGGKTTTGLWRIVLTAFRWPLTRPGLRRFRAGVIRRMMVDLERTTIPSWHNWFPRRMGAWRGSRGEPQTHEFSLRHPADGSTVEIEVIFRGIGDARIEEALRGWEVSAIYADECDTLDPGSLSWLSGRTGRFPPPLDGQALDELPGQVWGTCNAPEPDNHVLRDFIDEPMPGWRLYRQPSGLAPDAENLSVLGPTYYARKAADMPPWQRKRMIENVPGVSPDLAAVYPEFNPDLHVAPAPLDVLAGRPVLVGMDAGGTPAAGVWQVAANGQRRLLAEISTHDKAGGITGPQRFGEALARLLGERFAGCQVRALGDPSAAYGADQTQGEGSWLDIVGRVAELPIRPAPSNDPTLRREALRVPMSQLIDGRHPALLICPSCRLTVRALARDYRFAVTAGRVAATPLKNWASHLIEAHQYALMDGGAFHEIQARRTAREDQAAPRVAPAFNPFRRIGA